MANDEREQIRKILRRIVQDSESGDGEFSDDQGSDPGNPLMSTQTDKRLTRHGFFIVVLAAVQVLTATLLFFHQKEVQKQQNKLLSRQWTQIEKTAQDVEENLEISIRNIEISESNFKNSMAIFKGDLKVALNFAPVIDELLVNRELVRAIRTTAESEKLSYLESNGTGEKLKVYRTWKQKKRWPSFPVIIDRNSGLYVGVTYGNNGLFSVEEYNRKKATLAELSDNFTIDFFTDDEFTGSVALRREWIKWDEPLQRGNGIKIPIEIPETSLLNVMGTEKTIYVKFPHISVPTAQLE